ncbi:MAG TPA: glycine betaine/L-proline ABC transporter substrate-binding protein ProX, partial [Elainellaceae cyanobacterium]
MVNIARPTWDTGWFQAEVFRELLNQLGYSVSEPQTMENAEFYQAVAEGDVDLWANGWFPLHRTFLEPDSVSSQAEAVGFEVRGGALQGYLIDKKTADQFNIRNLEALKNPDVAQLFDSNGNGKADLIGCNPEWNCAQIIDHHLTTYGLDATVEHIQGDYTPLMETIIQRYTQGKPILFYTWTPNWTVNRLVPGQDVVWIEVPFPSLPPDQTRLESETVLTGITGCVADPCSIGFSRNDIRAVANSSFLDANPAIRTLLEQIEIPLNDIADQNAKMLAGEDEEADIRRHALEWIQANQIQVDAWLAAAAAADSLSPADRGLSTTETVNDSPVISKTLRVVTKRFEPFVSYENRQYIGFSIDLWDAIAQELGIDYDIVGVNSAAKLLDEVERGAADVAMAGIGITSQREETLDFSHSFFESGLQIMVRDEGSVLLNKLIPVLVGVLRSPQFYYGVGGFLFILLIVAHIIWLSEHRHNSQFPSSYVRGIWEAFWWAAVTVTTVGYGDKVPKRALGRFFGLIWMFSGYFVFAYFTASIATTFTVQELQGTINGPEDLPGKRIATISSSAAA